LRSQGGRKTEKADVKGGKNEEYLRDIKKGGDHLIEREVNGARSTHFWKGG